MSDTTIITAAPRTAPDYIHELFWGQINANLGEQLERYQPKMGTVSGTTGAYLMVLPDGSATPRKMAHVAGRRYRVGDRVIFGPVKGQPVVYGGVLTATGVAGEGVVSMADIDQQFLNTLTSFQNTLSSFQGTITDHEGRITTAQARADDAWTKADNARNRADNAFSNAATAQTTANTANTAATNIKNRTNIAGTALETALGDGIQAHLRLQNNIDPRMDTVCLKLCGNATCRSSTVGCTAQIS